MFVLRLKFVELAQTFRTSSPNLGQKGKIRFRFSTAVVTRPRSAVVLKWSKVADI